MSFWDGTRWVAETSTAVTTSPRRGRRFLGAAAEAGLITLLIFGLVASSAFAAKGGNKGGGGGGKHNAGSGSVSLVMVNDANQDGAPNWADTVTFDVSTDSTSQPNLDLTCRQDGVVVYGASTGYYDGYPWPWTQNMTLRSAAWDGGAASCTARLYAFAGSRTKTLATLTFTADA